VVKRGVALVGLWVVAVPVTSCAAIAGLGDYELAARDASVGDAVSESDVALGEGNDVASGGDAGDGGDSGDGAGDAAGDVGEAGTVGDSSAVEAEADARDDGPSVPPSDKGHVLCGGNLCSLPAEACCDQPDASTCQSAASVNCNAGLIARCDESANCVTGQVCCVTNMSASALETQCRSSCQGGDPQSCRTDGECGGSGPCEAWMCSGSVVATCGAAGSAPGCQ
jgi:hypothetical protein